MLRLNTAALAGWLLDDSRLAGVRVSLACPGESVRLIHVRDIVQPVWKAAGPGGVFPGFLGPVSPVGRGTTHRLEGIAVVEVVPLDDVEPKYRSMAESLVDMAGPVADYCPYSRTQNVVLELQPQRGLTPLEFDAAARLAGLRTAEYLARLTAQAPPDAVETRSLPTVDPALPRVGYLLLTSAQVGDIPLRTFLYGRDTTHLFPTLVHPNELLDGAMVSGNYAYACNKHPTFLHQNNPIVLELLRRHGRELQFAGIAVSRGYGITPEDKELYTSYAAKLLKLLRAEAAVVTHEGGGHGEIDLFMAAQHCEEMGIRAVLVTNEIAGAAGADPGMVDFDGRADAIVTTGNKEQVLSLPAVERVIGGDVLYGVDGVPQNALTIPIRLIYAGSDHLGATRLTAVDY